MLDTLKAHHTLAIARLGVFKDSVAARRHPGGTIRKGGGPPREARKGDTGEERERGGAEASRGGGDLGNDEVRQGGVGAVVRVQI